MSAEHEITTLIRSFRELTGVGICFYDTENFFRYGRTGAREYVGHYCEFCRCARLLPGGRTGCDKSDRGEAMELAKAYGKPFFHRCHMGLCELVVPVIREERILGIIFLGQCRIVGEEREDEVKESAEAMGGDGDNFAALYRELPSMKREDLTVMGELFHLYFSRIGDGISFFGNSGMDDEAVSLPVAKRIALYIERNYQSELSSKLLSERFFLNPSYMARVFRRDVGMSVTEFLRSIRLGNACRLLRSTDIPVGSIALNVGYADVNYFCRLFRREMGMTPSEYRDGKSS